MSLEPRVSCAGLGPPFFIPWRRDVQSLDTSTAGLLAGRKAWPASSGWFLRSRWLAELRAGCRRPRRSSPELASPGIKCCRGLPVRIGSYLLTLWATLAFFFFFLVVLLATTNKSIVTSQPNLTNNRQRRRQSTVQHTQHVPRGRHPTGTLSTSTISSVLSTTTLPTGFLPPIPDGLSDSDADGRALLDCGPVLCIGIATVTQSCGCPEPIPTVYLSFPCPAGRQRGQQQRLRAGMRRELRLYHHLPTAPAASAPPSGKRHHDGGGPHRQRRVSLGGVAAQHECGGEAVEAVLGVLVECVCDGRTHRCLLFSHETLTME